MENIKLYKKIGYFNYDDAAFYDFERNATNAIKNALSGIGDFHKSDYELIDSLDLKEKDVEYAEYEGEEYAVVYDVDDDSARYFANTDVDEDDDMYLDWRMEFENCFVDIYKLVKQ